MNETTPPINYSYREFYKMTTDDLRLIRQSLVKWIGTEYERMVRAQSEVIGNILHERSGFGL